MQTDLITKVYFNEHLTHSCVGMPQGLQALSSSLFMDPLTHVLNLSMLQGVVPNELKIARVIPLFKADNNMLISNYRPVSVLPVFSKILERLMYNRLYSFIIKHDVLYKYQFGFRKGHSTIMALIVLVDKIMSALDNGDFVLGFFY